MPSASPGEVDPAGVQRRVVEGADLVERGRRIVDRQPREDDLAELVVDVRQVDALVEDHLGAERLDPVFELDTNNRR